MIELVWDVPIDCQDLYGNSRGYDRIPVRICNVRLRDCIHVGNVKSNRRDSCFAAF